MATLALKPKKLVAAQPKKSRIVLLLLLPGLIYLGLFFITPFAALISTSLQQPVLVG
jgi:spermidine/putrescine transport system permease protein